MNSTDKYILNTSMEAQENEFLFEKKEMVYNKQMIRAIFLKECVKTNMRLSKVKRT
jgi:hypothetical protein